MLLFLTRSLSLLPSAVLSTNVFMIGVKLIDARGMRELYRLQRNEFFVALATAVIVAFVGVLQGICVAVGLSLIGHVRHSFRPRTRPLTRDAAGEWHAVFVAPGIFAAPDVIVYRFGANLFYANAGRFTDKLFGLLSTTTPPVRAIVFEAPGNSDVYYSAAKTLSPMGTEFTRRGVRVTVGGASAELRDEFARFGLDIHAVCIKAGVNTLSRSYDAT